MNIAWTRPGGMLIRTLQALRSFALAALLALALPLHAQQRPVYIGIDAEFGQAGSTSAQAIRQGILIAIEEINRAGGVLGGRPLALVERDNRGVSARGIENLRELAAHPDLVAVFCGKFSPAVLEALPLIHEQGLVLLDPWAAVSGIVDNGYSPNYAFRLSLRDDWAIPAMMKFARDNGYQRIGLLLLNTAWGRSSQKAAEEYVAKHPQPVIAGTRWFHYGDRSFAEQYRALLAADAQAIILVANEREGALFIQEAAELQNRERLPIISHWGITGGNFLELAGPALREVQLSVVQTYSFIGAKNPKAERVLASTRRLFGVQNARALVSPVGVAHAYDLTHILALAIDKAGSTKRTAIRDALEQVRNYRGLVKNYPRPFTPERHEALSEDDVFMAAFASDGALVRIASARR